MMIKPAPFLKNVIAPVQSNLAALFGKGTIKPTAKLDLKLPARTLTTSTTYDYAGRQQTTTDENGQTTTYRYDHLGRLEATEFPNGGGTEISYHDWGAPNAQYVEETTRTHTVPQSKTIKSLWKRRYFDGNGRVYETRKQAQKDYIARKFESYFANGARVDLASRPHFGSESAQNIHWTVVENDELARPKIVKKRRGATRQGGGTDLGTTRGYRYFPDHVQISHNVSEQSDDGTIYGYNWQTTQYYSDARGLLVKHIDALGNGTIYSYDGARRLNGIIGPHSAIAAPTFEPGALSCAAFSCRLFEHDNWGRRLSAHDDDTGANLLLLR